MTILLILCLVATLLPTAALASEAAGISASYSGSGEPLKAGVAANGTITVTATGYQFDQNGVSNVTASAGNTGLTIESTTAMWVDESHVTFSISNSTPTQGGDITITAAAGAFTEPNTTATATTTIAVAPADLPSVSATASGLKAGTEGKINLTINGNNTFASGVQPSSFTLSGGAEGNPSAVGTGGNRTIELTVTPTKADDITISIDKAAFTYQPTELSVTATGTVTVNAADDPTVNASGTLTAGVSNGSISLQIDGGTNTFAEPLQASWFTLNTNNGDSLTVAETPTGGGTNSTSLTLAAPPTKAGNVTGITIDKQAFKYQPGGNVTATGIPLTINGATVEMSQPAAITEGKDTTITLNLTAGTFADSLSTGNFTVSGGGGVTLKEVSESGTQSATLTLTAAPTTTESITVTAKQDAFKYQPSADVTKTVTVNPPTGTVSAELTGELYAGTEVSGQTITLTAGGDLTFKEAQKANFSLSGAGSSGLDFTASGSGTNVTLALSGTPTTAGNIGVMVNKEAFTYAPDSEVSTDESITVKAAPTVTLSGTGSRRASPTRSPSPSARRAM